MLAGRVGPVRGYLAAMPLTPTSPITHEQVNGWLLDSARTVDELTNVLGVVKGQLEAASMQGRTVQAFQDATQDAEAQARRRFGG